MTRLDCITEAYLLAAAKTTLPTGAKLSQLNALAMKFYRDWQREPDIEWESLSRDVSAGIASAANTSYELADEINFISKDDNNYVKINNVPYKVVSSAQLQKYRNGRAVAHVVEDGTHSIQFSQAFSSDSPLLGKEILVPSIIKLDDILTDNAPVLIDDPNWLSVRVAAQYCFSYKSLRDMYPDLLDQANELMKGMMAANSTGTETTSTGVDYFATLGNVGNIC